MDLEEEMVFLLILLYLYHKRKSLTRIERISDNASTSTGHAYTQELLRGSNPQCQELMCTSQEAYVLLCNHFKQKNWLQDCRYISLEEKIAMFLTIIRHDEHFNMAKQRFQHSTQTIRSCFYEVLKGMIKFAKEEFKTEVAIPTSSDVTSPPSKRHKNLRGVFSGAIGALDGILVPAIVPAGEETVYRRRRGRQCYQNVLAICDFDMIFKFVWAGWEGAVHDTRVLKEVAFDETANFPIPSPNKYYLCDAEYDNTRGYLAPYRNKRSRLANVRSGCTTKENRFNHAHAQLRNIIERAYSVLKTRFPIMTQMIPIPYTSQRDVVIACFTIHNFIRRSNIYDQLFMKCDESTAFVKEEHYKESGEARLDGTHWDAQDKQYMDNLRDQIANELVSKGLS